MKFKVIRGIHTEGGQVYEAGTDHNIVESDKDLIKIFNNNGKFERITIPVDQLDQTANCVILKNEVTDDFKGASEMNLQVFFEGRQYFIINVETNQPVHQTKITSKDSVNEVLKGLK